MNRRPAPSPSAHPPVPPDSNPRLLAWQILRAWKPDGVYADEMVDHTARRHSLSPPNRAFLNAMVLAVLRNLTLLDGWIDVLRDGGKLDHDTRGWLRLGLAQCLLLGLPEHAAVHETVDLAGRGRGLVNAVLRRALRERQALEDWKEQSLPEVKFSLPPFLLHRWEKRYHPAGRDKLAEWCQTPAPVIVRANELISGSTARLEEFPGTEPVENYPGFYRCAELPRALLASGHCYAQDPSTSAAPALLSPGPDMVVLDACAAPGGKAAILASMMGNQGHLMATDSSPKRLERLRSNLTRLQVRNAESFVHDWESGAPPASWKQRFPEGIDRILLDTPCSNTGVIRRRVDVRWRLQPSFLQEIVPSQEVLLERLLPLLRPGGRLAYSTCSIEPEENEAVVKAVLSRLPGYRILQTRSLVPHLSATDGAWVALLERVS